MNSMFQSMPANDAERHLSKIPVIEGDNSLFPSL